MGRGSWLARLPSAKKRHVEGWAFRPSEGVHMMCGRSPCGWWLHLGYPYGAALTSGPNEPQMRSLSQRDGRILEGKSTRRSAGDADIKASTSRVIRPRTTSKHAFARPASCEGCGRMHKGDRRKGWFRTGFGGGDNVTAQLYCCTPAGAKQTTRHPAAINTYRVPCHSHGGAGVAWMEGGSRSHMVLHLWTQANVGSRLQGAGDRSAKARVSG